MFQTATLRPNGKSLPCGCHKRPFCAASASPVAFSFAGSIKLAEWSARRAGEAFIARASSGAQTETDGNGGPFFHGPCQLTSGNGEKRAPANDLLSTGSRPFGGPFAFVLWAIAPVCRLLATDMPTDRQRVESLAESNPLWRAAIVLLKWGGPRFRSKLVDRMAALEKALRPFLEKLQL